MKPADKTPENVPFDPENPAVGQWAWVTPVNRRSMGSAARIECVTKTGRVRVRSTEYRKGSNGYACTDRLYASYLAAASPEQITEAVRLEQAEASRLEAIRLERAEQRKRLASFDWTAADDATVWRVANALGWTK